VSNTVSEVSIANQALTWLGQKPILSFSDQSTTAEWMVNNYEHIRNAVLEERMWTFATVRAKSDSMEKDAWNNLFKHAIPLNWLGVFRVYTEADTNMPDKSWRLEGSSVLSRESTIYMWGLFRLEDTTKFSPMFVQALAARLAADACIPFTENAELQQDMWSLYAAKLEAAAARDGQQGANDKIKSTVLTGARNSGSMEHGGLFGGAGGR
jgi:hypothetical protein